jgi:signal transduction histidine kinase
MENGIPGTLDSSFSRIEGYVRRLRRLVLLLVGILVVLPTSIFTSIEIRHFQERTQMHARQIASLITEHLEKEGPNLATLSPRLWDEMESSKILYLQVLGGGGKEILRLGEPKSQVITLAAEASLSPQGRPFRSVAIQRDAGPLFLEAARVFGIHIFVATVLALTVYAIPMKALRRTLADLKATQAQIIHADKLSAIGEMYAGLTHEINNPLSIILSRTKLHLRSAQERQCSPELVHDLEVIERHGTRIAEILRGLLTFARKTPLQFVQTDLNRVLNEVIALVEKPFSKEGIRIVASLDPELPTLSGSPNHLQQVFLNLLNNARDAMPHGGQIAIHTFKSDTHLVTEVQDTGTGIAPSIRDVIFEPFFTTKEVGKGTGLGLAVSYGIVKAHRGEITVESAPGEGATFRVKFPLGEVRS